MNQPGRIAIRLSILALWVAVVIWMIARLGPRRVLQLAGEADPVWLALSVIPLAGRFLIWAAKWLLMLRRQGEVPFSFTLQAVLAGAFVNLTTPTAKLAGGVVRAALLHRHTGWKMPQAFGWTLADQVTNLLGDLALAGLLALGAVLVLPTGGAAWSLMLGSGSLAVAVVLGALLLRKAAWRWIRRPAVVRWFIRRTPARFREPEADVSPGTWVVTALEPLLKGKGSRFLVDVGLAACGFGFLCLAHAMVIRALGVEAPLLLVTAAVALSYLAGTLLGTMGGIGATELALIELSALVGLPRAAATAGALLHRAGFYLLTLAGGGLALWRASASRRPATARRR